MEHEGRELTISCIAGSCFAYKAWLLPATLVLTEHSQGKPLP
jgi:hypothetical protein